MLWTVLCQLSGLFLFVFQISGTRVMGIIFLIIKSDIYQKKKKNWHVRNAASLTWKIVIPKGKKLSCTRSPRGSSSLWQNSQLAQTSPLSCIFHYGDLWSYILCWFPFFFFLLFLKVFVLIGIIMWGSSLFKESSSSSFLSPMKSVPWWWQC